MKRLLTILFVHFCANIFAQNVGIGTTTPTQLFTVSKSGIGITQQSPDASTQIGFYTTNGAAYLQTHSNHDLFFATNNGVTQMALKTNGNFGIGNTNPSNKLDVTGNFRATGNAVIGGSVQIQGGSPAAGKILTSDASGNASWQTPDVPTCMLNSTAMFNNLAYTNFTIPAGTTKVFVLMWGSGGDGSTTATLGVQFGGGGGGGAYASFYLDVTPGSLISGRINAGSGYTVFKYNGDSVRCLNGDDANILGPGEGGIILLGGVNFTLTGDILGVHGQDGKPNSFSNYTLGASSFTEYIGGDGGGSYQTYGQLGQVTLVSGASESIKADLSGPSNGIGCGGGAVTRTGGTTSGNRSGGGGRIIIYY